MDDSGIFSRISWRSVCSIDALFSRIRFTETDASSSGRVPLTSVEGDNKGVALIQDMREPFDEINHGTGFVVG